jgi:hypothetical protein
MGIMTLGSSIIASPIDEKLEHVVSHQLRLVDLHPIVRLLGPSRNVKSPSTNSRLQLHPSAAELLKGLSSPTINKVG